MLKTDISASLYRKFLILCSKILLNVLHKTNSTVLLPWQHTGFQTSPLLKAFLATFGVPFWYLLMVARMHDSASIWISYFEFLAPCNVFLCWKSPTDWNKVGGDWKRASCHGNIIFIAVSVFPLELLAYQVSMVCGANWPR